jgi:MiaB/RimO family radical SAM methylthiotransferase
MEKLSVAILSNSGDCERHVGYFSRLEQYFIYNNYEISTDLNANRILIVGCGFHNRMFDRVRATLTELEEKKISQDNIIILGCVQKTHEQRLKEIFHGDVIHFNNEHLLDEIIQAKVKFSEIPTINEFNRDFFWSQRIQNDLYYIKIAQGCLNNCAYCVIKKAKGNLVSIPENDILKQFKDGVAAGYRKFYLMAEDTFSYGFDLKTTIIDLIRKMLEIQKNVEFSFGSLHSNWLLKFGKEIVEFCREGCIKSLYLGMQHVNKDILKKMGRAYYVREMVDILKEIKVTAPGVRLITDIIVGFPGETGDQFNELVQFFSNEKVFDSVFHFGYSDMPGSRAFNFENKVPATEIALRWKKLNTCLGSSSALIQNFKSEDAIIQEQNYFFCKSASKLSLNNSSL